jgi:hypothetical protein
MKLLSLEFKLCSAVGFSGLLFLFIHVGAIFCICLISILWWVKIALTLCILTSLIAVIRRDVLRSSDKSIGGFCYEGDDKWCLKKKSGELVPVVISYPVFISNFFIVANFTAITDGQKISLLVFQDALLRDDFRRLKMVLKMA